MYIHVYFWCTKTRDTISFSSFIQHYVKMVIGYLRVTHRKTLASWIELFAFSHIHVFGWATKTDQENTFLHSISFSAENFGIATEQQFLGGARAISTWAHWKRWQLQSLLRQWRHSPNCGMFMYVIRLRTFPKSITMFYWQHRHLSAWQTNYRTVLLKLLDVNGINILIELTFNLQVTCEPVIDIACHRYPTHHALHTNSTRRIIASNQFNAGDDVVDV